jgi:hypothetical protein
MNTQTNARVYPSYVLAETSARGGINLLGAFSEAVNEHKTNSILSPAISELRAYSASFDTAYGMAERRAEFIPSSLAQAETPDGWTADDVATGVDPVRWTGDGLRFKLRPGPSSHTPRARGSRGRNAAGAGCTSPR